MSDAVNALDSAGETLPVALARYQIDLPAEQVELLARYALLLWEWNEKLNLTRHTTWDKFVGRDVVDSLAFSKCLAPQEDTLDVGTGGGVPGVVLAIVRPDISVSLCDSVAKKARAVEAIVGELGLDVPVHRARVQDLLAEDHTFDTLLVRAVAPLEKLLTWLKPHWAAFHRLLVLKGPAWVEERKTARERGLMNTLQLRKLLSYPLPGTESESVLLEIRPKAG
jgi:16S rRNA (guanine527-N7)-methyltransferase